MVKFGTGVKCVDADTFVQALAEHLQKKGEIEVPQWHTDIKTGCRKQMPPQDPNWLFVRTASVARQLYCRSKGVGVGTLARFYGGRKRATVTKKHFSNSSRGLIRYCLQQLTEMGLAELEGNEDFAVRRLTPAGRKELDTVADACQKSSGYISGLAAYGEELQESDDESFAEDDFDDDSEDVEDEEDLDA